MSLIALAMDPAPEVQAAARTFSHASFSAAVESILEATKLGPGIVMLTGAVGTGKTTLVQDLAERLEREGYCVGRVANSRVEPEDLLRLVSFAFGLKAQVHSKARLFSELADRLAATCPRGKPVVLIIDEAQDLAPGALPELCQLGGLQSGETPQMQILLAGRDRIWQLLDRPDHADVRRRIIANVRLYPLSFEEARAYIAHSLASAGWTGDPGISGNALRLIHARTGGVPRLMSLTLGHLLLHGRTYGARVLEAQDVETVLAHLGRDHPELLVDSANPMPHADGAPARPLSSRDSGTRALSVSPEPQSGTRRAATSDDAFFHSNGVGPVASERHRDSVGWDRRWGLAVLLAGAAMVVLFATFYDALNQEDPPAPIGQLTPGQGATSAAVPLGGIAPPPVDADKVEAEPPQAPLAGLDTDTPSVAEPEIAAALEGAEHAPLARVESGPRLEDLGRGLPSADTLAQDPDVAQSASAVTDEPLPGLESASAAPGQQASPPAEVGPLLARAESALSRNRLMAPASDNAYRYYQEVLALDPANDQAKAGLARIVGRYRALAQQSLKQGRRSDARLYASRGLKLAPRDRDLLAIQRQASRSRPARSRGEASGAETPEETASNLIDRLHAWLRSGRTDSSLFLDQ